jgi:basic membrane protein A
VYHWEVVLNDIIANLEEGVLGGEAYTLTLENGGLTVDISESTGLDEETVTAISAQIDELITGIIAGDIVVLPPEPEATPAS